MHTQAFSFPAVRNSVTTSTQVRTIIKNGDPWFVAKDIASILGYRDAEKMTRNLDDDEKDTQIVGTLGGNQELAIINESGLFAAILRSRRKEASDFRKWVTSVVLPSIRKHGGYTEGQEELSDELVASLHRTIRENALPALLAYDRLTQHDHWKSATYREVSREKAIQEVAIKYDLPVSVVKKLTEGGVAALSA